MRRTTGNKGYIKWNTVIIPIVSWDQTLEVDDEEWTDTSALGYRGVDAVCEKASANVVANLDMDQLPTGAVLDLKPGAKHPIELYIGDPAVDNKKWTYSGLLKTLQITSAVKSIVKFTANFLSDGTVTHPV